MKTALVLAATIAVTAAATNDTLITLTALERTAPATNVVRVRSTNRVDRLNATNRPPFRPFTLTTNVVTRHTLTFTWRGKTRAVTEDEPKR